MLGQLRIFLTLVIFLFTLTYCAKSEEAVDLENETLSACGTSPAVAQVELGESSSFRVRPPGVVGPLNWERIGTSYANDPSNPTPFASGASGVETTGFFASSVTGTQIQLMFTYGVKAAQGAAEARVAEQYPGMAREKYKITDEGTGKSLTCYFITQISPTQK